MKKVGDGVTKVKFYVGFRYNGLTAWEVTRISDTKPVYIDNDIFEIEDFDKQFEEALQVLNIDECFEEKVKIENVERPKLKGVTVVKTIDISQFDKYIKKR